MNAPKAARGHSGGVLPGQPCKIGVAPRSGSARGLAHTGVLRTIWRHLRFMRISWSWERIDAVE